MKVPFGQRSIVLRVAAALMIGAACLLVAGCGGDSKSDESDAAGKPGKITPSSPFAEPPAGVIDGHQLLRPECLPVEGRKWTFPGPQKISSTLYESYAINYPCAAAKKWTQRLLTTKIPYYPKSGKETVLQGPKGYYCSAWPDKDGYAYAGACQIREGQKAFGWNWNVSHRRVVQDPGVDGVPVLKKLKGNDAQMIITKIGDDTFRLDVRNTSYIGHIDRFNWSPPPGWTIKELKKVTGGKCELSAANMIWCTGQLKHPSCTCKGDGQVLSIEFSADFPPDTMKHGHPLRFGAAFSVMHILQMTPVPYLVPQTPEAAEKQKDI